MNTAVRRGVRPGDGDNGVLTSVVINVGLFSVLVVAIAVVDGPPRLSETGVAAFVAAGLCSTFLGRITLFGGIRRIGAVRAAALKNGTPLVALFLAVAVLGEQLAPLGWAGITLVMLGVALVVRESLERSRSTDLGTTAPGAAAAEGFAAGALAAGALAEGGVGEPGPARPPADAERSPSAQARRSMLVGVALALLAALTFGFGQLLRKVGMDVLPDALVGAAVGSWAALVASAVLAGLRGELHAMGRQLIARRPWFWLAGLAGGIGQLSSFAALAYAPLAYVSVVAGSETILTVLFSGLLVRRAEHLTRELLLPATLVCVGVAAIALAR